MAGPDIHGKSAIGWTLRKLQNREDEDEAAETYSRQERPPEDSAVSDDRMTILEARVAGLESLVRSLNRNTP